MTSDPSLNVNQPQMPSANDEINLRHVVAALIRQKNLSPVLPVGLSY